MGALKREKLYTTDYIYSLPEGERAEIIDGYVYDKAAPSVTHQRLLSMLVRRIGNYIEGKHGSCEVLPAPFGVFLDNDEYTYVEPDISVICDPSKLGKRGCSGAPDWIIEIVSLSSRRMDYAIKLRKYMTSGVREYWIADPARNRIMVYDLEHDNIEEYTFEDKVKVNIYSNLEIDFSEFEI